MVKFAEYSFCYLSGTEWERFALTAQMRNGIEGDQRARQPRCFAFAIKRLITRRSEGVSNHRSCWKHHSSFGSSDGLESDALIAPILLGNAFHS
jgi:hypothetical protein